MVKEEKNETLCYLFNVENYSYFRVFNLVQELLKPQHTQKAFSLFRG